MNAGMAFAIHDKALFDRNRKRVLQIINKENKEMYGIYNASVIKFRDHYFLIIDGHTSILDREEYFAPAIAKIICPNYRKNKKEVEGHNLFNGLLQVAGNHDDLLETEEQRREFLDSLAEMGLGKTELLIWKLVVEYIEKGGRESFIGEREDVYEGVIYGERSPYVRFVLDMTEEEQEQVVQDMFQATVQKKDIGEVKFLETLYELEV